MSSRKAGTSKFGWCLDGLHEKCWANIDHMDYQLHCGCECHTGVKPKPVPKLAKVSVPEQPKKVTAKVKVTARPKST